MAYANLHLSNLSNVCVDFLRTWSDCQDSIAALFLFSLLMKNVYLVFLLISSLRMISMRMSMSSDFHLFHIFSSHARDLNMRSHFAEAIFQVTMTCI